jgi:hypothetical protein
MADRLGEPDPVRGRLLVIGYGQEAGARIRSEATLQSLTEFGPNARNRPCDHRAWSDDPAPLAGRRSLTRFINLGMR